VTGPFRRPSCGNTQAAHGPHQFARWSSDTGQGGLCDGWTPMEAGVTAMAAAVLAATATNEITHPRREDMPELRLELSPAACAALRQCLDVATLPAGGLPDSMFGVPVVLAADLPPGGWRITEARPVLAEGTVSMDTRPHPDQAGPPPLRTPWDDPEVMAVDFRQAVRDIGAGLGPLIPASGYDAGEYARRMAVYGPCEDCGAARDTRPRASYGVEGVPGSAGVYDQLFCPSCGWPGPAATTEEPP
jgi:hypothetical protein